MKGGNIVGLLLIFAGTVITYAGWKNVPVLSVIGIGSVGGSSTPNYDRTATQVAQENSFPTGTISYMGNPQNVRTVSTDTVYSTTPSTSTPHNVKRVGQ